MSASRAFAVMEGRSAVACGVAWAAERLAPPGSPDAETVAACRLRDVGADFAFVRAGRPRSAELLSALVAAGVEPVWAVDGPLTRVAMEYGWREAMRGSVRDTGSFDDRIAAAMERVVQEAARGVEAGARVFVLADELASSAGWLIPPGAIVSRLIPAFAGFVAVARDARGHAIMHSDGDIATIVPALAQAGFGGVHTASVDDAGQSALWGTIRAAGLVPAGGVPAASATSTPGTVADAVARLAGLGPLLVCDDGAIESESDLEAVGAILRSVRRSVGEPRP